MENFKYLIIPFISLIISQLIKFTIESISSSNFKWKRLFNGNGGMPSSHASFTFSLAMTLGFEEGFKSPLFAVAFIFSLIVCYDSMGIRMESSNQAVAINSLIKNMEHKDLKKMKKLKEKQGHKPLEVIMGCLLALIISFLSTCLF